MMPIPTLAALREEARRRGPARVAVAAAESETALAAAIDARRAGIAEPVLVGGRDALRARLVALGEDPAGWTVEHAASDADAAARAVALVREGGADVLMKGRLQTRELLRAVLDRRTGLRGAGLLSDVVVAEHPLAHDLPSPPRSGGPLDSEAPPAPLRSGRAGGQGEGAPRLLGITDGGVNVAPTLAEKVEILRNAVALFRRLGHARPRVACLCAVELVSAAMPHTEEAAALAAMSARGELADCLVSGPLALDNALSEEAARAKGIDHPVAGHADILLAPTIEVGNALGKAFTWLAHRAIAHLIVGASAPVLIPSRVERAEDKLFSIALGVVAARAAREAMGGEDRNGAAREEGPAPREAGGAVN